MPEMHVCAHSKLDIPLPHMVVSLNVSGRSTLSNTLQARNTGVNGSAMLYATVERRARY